MSSENATATLVVRVFDGTRQLVKDDFELAITIINGNQRQVIDHKYFKGSVHSFKVDFFNNFGDKYSVIITADGYKDGGCRIKVSDKEPKNADLMLLPTHAKIKFPDGDWSTLNQNQPEIAKLLAYGATEDEAKIRYTKRLQEKPEIIAAFMNITTAMSTVRLSKGSALDYMQAVIWDEMQQDRFFGYAEQTLIQDVAEAAERGEFKEEKGAGAFHAGATLSYKQVSFAEADVQLTFHQNDPTPQPDWVKIELDIDYYQDLIAHGFGEVLPNHITHGLTNPEKVYVLRWTVGQQSDTHEFDPPYVIA